MLKLFNIALIFSLMLISNNGYAQEPVTLQLKWFHGFQFAGYYTAKEQGYYAEQGIDVTILPRDKNVSPIDEVLRNKAQFGIADSSIVLHRLNNKPLVIASVILQSSPLVFMSLQDAGINSPYELRGKKVMFQRNVDDASLQALLQLVGLRDSDYQYIKHTFNDNALLNGTADVMSAYRSNQPIAYARKGVSVDLIDPASYGIDFYGDLIFTSESYVAENRSIVDGFITASKKGWSYALQNKGEVAKLLREKYGVEASEAQIIEEANAIESAISPNFVPLGTIHPERFDKISRIYKNLGLSDDAATIKGLFLSDYDEFSFTLERPYLYGLLIFIGFIIYYSFVQYSFNRRLRYQVGLKTKELEQVNQELLKKNQELLTETQRADSANEAKSRFLSNISHEIRTPINGIYGTLQVLKREEMKDRDTGLLNKALYSSKSLLTIINDLLDFSKIEAGKMTFENIPFSFFEVIDSVESDLSELVNKKQLSFSIEKDSTVNEYWIGDEVRVKQILLNLCSNAVKFTESGSITIKLKAGDALNFEVIDTGIGIPEAESQKLFSRFEQGNISITRKYGGTGLGLAITQSLVDLMLGKLSVESKLGEGSRFLVSLPLKSFLGQFNASSEETLVLPPDFSGKSILVVDDNEINLAVVESMLQNTHAKLSFANDGLQAVKIALSNSFDLILMDIQMPNLDGVSASKQIKEVSPKVPIIALTANVGEEDIEYYNQNQFDGHIGKPIDIPTLYSVCEQKISKNRDAEL